MDDFVLVKISESFQSNGLKILYKCVYREFSEKFRVGLLLWYRDSKVFFCLANFY